MNILKGIAAQGGIAKGVICLYSDDIHDTIPHYAVAKQQTEHEIKRLENAFELAKNEMGRMISVAEKNGDRKAVDIFNTHLMMINDHSLYDKISALVRTRLVNAEHAVSDIFEEYIKKYEAQEGHFKELTHDFVDTRNRLLSGFKAETGKFKCEIGEKTPVIVATKRLTPSMVLNADKHNVLAFVAEEGGFTSHATIIARSFGVPIVFGIDVDKELDCGMQAVVDGSGGKLIVSPDAETARYYEKKIEKIQLKKGACSIKKDMFASTRSGERISLKLNITTPEELELAAGMPHDGVGLLRTEFLFLERGTPPTEDEQFRMYSRIFKSAGGKDVTVRLLDISADKLPMYLEVPAGVNADMELRGAMAVETFQELYITQVKALLRADTQGNMKLLFPMVSDLADLKTFKDIVKESRARLVKENAVFNRGRVPEGIMIETPAAVMMAAELAKKTDFINIGSNDLLSYTLAALRGSMLSEKRYHILHPALVKMLEKIARAGKAAKKEVCLCGEVASFEEYYPVLLETGLGAFSVSVAKFPDIKCQLHHLKKPAGKKAITGFYKTESKADADRYLSKYI